MILLLLILALGVQRAPAPASEGGTVSGILKSADGTPAAGARVAAVLSDPSSDPASEGALISITRTDENGRYQLENIPQGRYLITAGRVDLPTYYPGTADATKGKVLLITTGGIVSGIDFTIDAPSIRSGDQYDSFGRLIIDSAVNVPLEVKIEGGKFPVSANGQFTSLRLSPRTAGQSIDIALNESSFTLLVNSLQEFHVSVENLPAGYSVTSMTYGSVDLKSDLLRLTPPPLTPGATAYLAGAAAGLLAALNATQGNPPVPVAPSVQSPASIVPPLPVRAVTVMLSYSPPPPANSAGVRITGRAPERGQRLIYISGMPGEFFSDGSFEFQGVPAGRQTILFLNYPNNGQSLRGLATVTAARSIVVGDQPVDNVTLEYISMLPEGTRGLSTPGPASTRMPGPVPFAAIHGRIVDAVTQKPLTDAIIDFSGLSRASYHVNKDGQFEIPNLLPGSYKIEIGTFAHETIRQTIEIEDDDVSLDLSAMPL